jgi:hypothetical protein
MIDASASVFSKATGWDSSIYKVGIDGSGCTGFCVQALEKEEALHPGLLWEQMQAAYGMCDEVLSQERS